MLVGIGDWGLLIGYWVLRYGFVRFLECFGCVVVVMSDILK